MKAAASALLGIALLLASLPFRRELAGAAPPVSASPEAGLGRLAGSVLAGSFRPLLLNYLWLRADALYGKGRLEELQLLYRSMIHLYPRNERAREFLGFLLAFNLKSDAPTEDSGIAWAEEGLDILLGVPAARSTMAQWFLLQCGQNPLDVLRYAGPAWEKEKRIRAHFRGWCEARLGEPLHRFEAALRLNDALDTFAGRQRRATALYLGAIDEVVRTGSARTAAEAADALRAEAEGFRNLPDMMLAYVALAKLARGLAEGKPEALFASDRYDAAAALWGLGMHSADANLAISCLRRAKESFERMGLPEETEALDAWIRWRDSPSSPRPSAPFDGVVR